uniref:Cytoplasmic tRNA 2-thiolation protein 2 n=1 Tax=Rhabditophanes sp. KR3021 TaxID=114890 RepID=A0AC35UGX9_9BILA
MDIPVRKCVKCPEPGPYFGFDARRATYCKPCFIKMAKHKFSSALGKNRVFKYGTSKNPIIISFGDQNSAFLAALIHEGMSKGEHKKLDIQPTLVFVTDSLDTDYVSSYYERSKMMKEKVDWPHYFVHLASIFSNPFVIKGDLMNGIENIPTYTSFLSYFKSETAKKEINRVLLDILFVKLARYLECEKLLLPGCADELALTTCNALCFGRGASIAHQTEIVDSRFDKILMVRPLHDLSQKEIKVVFEFESYEDWKVNKDADEDKVAGNDSAKSVQSINSSFLVSLLNAGFPATITTLLSISGKVRPIVVESSVSCNLCGVKYESHDNEYFVCAACNDFVEAEMTSSAESHELLKSLLI